MPAGKLVTLDSSVTLPEARDAAQKLQAAGIPAYIRGEAAALIAADPALAVVQLEVAEEDFEHAQRVLSSSTGLDGLDDRQTADPDSDVVATVEVFYDVLEAKHAADLLAAAGIPCSLQGTSEGPLAAFCPEIPTLRLEVHISDLERAYEILGFTVDDEGNHTDAVPGERPPRSDHVQKAEPRASRKVKRPPFVQAGPDALPVEEAPVAEDDLGPPPSAPALEANSEDPDTAFFRLLLLIGGVIILGIMRVMLR